MTAPPLPQPGERVKGYIPAVDTVPDETGQLAAQAPKLIPWQESVLRGKNEPVPVGEVRNVPLKLVGGHEDVSQNEHVFESLSEGLPAPVRRNAQQRYESLVTKLMAAARVARKDGRTYWPASIQERLDLTGVKNTAPTEEQVYALAKHFILRSENQQRAKDSKKVVLDFHGHYD